MEVINYFIFRDNPYQEVLYGVQSNDFMPVVGSIEDALASQRMNTPTAIHIHWEEHVIRKAQTFTEASLQQRRFVERLDWFKKLGGKIIWTVHNEVSHEAEHADTLIHLRQHLAALADVIHVHNRSAIEVLSSQTDVPHQKLFLLPHPSYLGVYPGFDEVQPHSLPVSANALLVGKIRRYKGCEFFLEALEKIEGANIRGRIVGQPLKTENYGEELVERFSNDEKIELDFRFVDDSDLFGLLRTSTCVVLPYHRFLTSGIALLALSAGVPLIGPHVPQLVDVFPPEQHEFMFKPGDAASMARALERVASMNEDDYQRLSAMNIEQAKRLHPERISSVFRKRLAMLVGSPNLAA